MKPRVLITGATGFLGSYLYSYFLRSGFEVFGTTTGKTTQRILRCDITSQAEISAVLNEVRANLVIHCAAIASATSSQTQDYYCTNVSGTENVFRAAVDCGADRLILVSTAGVYGNQPAALLDESLSPMPVHHYGMSKYCSERIACNFLRDIHVAIVRPFNIVGPGQSEKFIVPKLVRSFSQRERSVKIGNVDVVRDFIDINDAVAMIGRVAGSDCNSGSIYNICSGKSVSIAEVIKCLSAMTGHQIAFEVSGDLVRRNEVWRLIGDPSKILALMGHGFTTRSIDLTLRDMLNGREDPALSERR